MNSEENFKNKLQELVDSKEFEFNETNWIKAQKLIENKRRNNIKFFIALAVVFFAAIGIYYSLANKKLDGISANYTTDSSLKKQLDIDKSEVKAQTDSIQNIQNNIDGNKIQSKIIENNDINRKILEKVELLKLVKNEANEENKNSSKQTYIAIKGELTSRKNNKNDNSKVVSKKREDYTAEIVESDNENKKSISGINLNNVADYKVGEDTKPIITSKNGIFEKNEDNTNAVKSIQEDSSKTIENMLNPSSIIDKSDSTYILRVENIAVDTSNFINTDSIPEENIKTATKERRSNLNIEFGADYLFGWKTNGAREANGFNPIVGINYCYQATKNVSVSVGLQYNAIGNMRETSLTTKNIKYNFGEETDVMTISALKMHYLIVPVKLQYQLNEINFMGVGGNINFLLDVNSKLEKYNTYLNFKSETVQSESRGYTEGIAPFDFQLSIFYRRKLMERFYIQIEFMVGFLDLKSNDFYKSTLNEKSTGIKLSCSYNLLKKYKK